ncbi:MAG: bifunctional diaminohydroxyphosphoribosylaminopyrimidine deaminase/5-amino-6-(5-phosphoribosylamino)uracil reductase RibD [Gammaproteobacteria bacterium]|nr:MAG: bifunctional diaminohydroxyphosphoribosylaminopyrimidine deaminase/5-amino-6-(5-phosphoribosylamino)uracil reductase RibD [Gammaproteobacteria bacterium]
MARAIRLAERGRYSTPPNPCVGCVLVRDGKVVGEGWHRRAGGPHAEVIALEMAGERSRGAACYLSLEPCVHHGRTPPCTEALIRAGVSRVVCAHADPNPRVSGKGLERLRQAGVEVHCGLLEAEARRLNPGFIRRMTRGLPLVRLKLAMSLDGRTAMASGESQWITSPQSRADVQRLRAGSGAVLTGIGTVLADDPALTVRDPRFDTAGRQPLRVVLDSGLRTPPDCQLLGEPGPVLICTCSRDRQARERLERAGAAVVTLPGEERIDLHAVLRELAGREVNTVLVEAGATLAGAFVGAGLVDELILYQAPKLLGEAARGLLQLPALERLEQAPRLEVTDLRRVGPDWRVTARPKED